MNGRVGLRRPRYLDQPKEDFLKWHRPFRSRQRGRGRPREGAGPAIGGRTEVELNHGGQHCDGSELAGDRFAHDFGRHQARSSL
jgi:hypothetical protein